MSGTSYDWFVQLFPWIADVVPWLVAAKGFFDKIESLALFLGLLWVVRLLKKERLKLSSLIDDLGQRTLVIPPDMGYGAEGRPPVIPPNSVLLFEVVLVAVR